MTNPRIFLITLITWGLSTGGCGKNGGFPSGHFEGNLLQKKAIAPLNDSYRPVGIDFSFGSDKSGRAKKSGKIKVTDQEGTLISQYEVAASSRKEFVLTIADLRSEPFHLKRVTPRLPKEFTTCYLDRSDWEAEFCYDGIQFRLRVLNQDKVGVLKLLGSSFGKEPEFPLEIPESLSVQEVVHRALNSNLDARIGFEHVVQAKGAVTAAYLNLIPHLTTNLIWNADPSFISVIATLQGLAPFLLPTYWMQAKESSWDLKIKCDADLITKANLAAMVEQLSYALNRDQNILMVQELGLKGIAQFREKVLSLEQVGQLDVGSAESIAPLFNQIQDESEKIDQLLLSDRYTISEALGFHSPEAVSAIRVDTDVPPSGSLLIKSDFAATVSRRSFELQQLDYLKEIAKLKKTELYFAWIDPTGDPKSGLGFNTVPQLKIANSQLKELDLKREQLKIAVYQNAYRIADEYNGTVEWLRSRKPESESIAIGVERVLSGYLSKETFNRDKIFSAVTDLLSTEIGNLANTTAYRIAKSKLDRVMLAGYYENIMPKTGEMKIDPGIPMK